MALHVSRPALDAIKHPADTSVKQQTLNRPAANHRKHLLLQPFIHFTDLLTSPDIFVTFYLLFQSILDPL